METPTAHLTFTQENDIVLAVGPSVYPEDVVLVPVKSRSSRGLQNLAEILGKPKDPREAVIAQGFWQLEDHL